MTSGDDGEDIGGLGMASQVQVPTQVPTQMPTHMPTHMPTEDSLYNESEADLV